MVENLLNMIRDIKKNSIKTSLISYYSTKKLALKLKRLVVNCKKIYNFIKNKTLNRLEYRRIKKLYKITKEQYNSIKTVILYRIKYNKDLSNLKYVVSQYDKCLLKYRVI